jgi:hypothetical protein
MKLNEAIRHGDQQAVRQAIASGEDLNRLCGDDEMSPSMVARTWMPQTTTATLH